VSRRRLEAGLGDPGVRINIRLHVLGGAAVIVLAALPAAREWVTDRR
jgi:hypothetical protein